MDIVSAILSIVVGIVVIVWPRLIAFLVGVYLIIIGILNLIAAI